MDALREVIEAALPRPAVEVQALVPYSRGDLVARVHAEGEVLHAEHTAEGTLLEARVPADLAAQLTATQATQAAQPAAATAATAPVPRLAAPDSREVIRSAFRRKACMCR